MDECSYSLGEDEDGRPFKRVPQGSRYIKSEDILYEIKKIQQEQVLSDGYVYEHVRRGMPVHYFHAFSVHAGDASGEDL